MLCIDIHPELSAFDAAAALACWSQATGSSRALITQQ
jgi:hypothetical protein